MSVNACHIGAKIVTVRVETAEEREMLTIDTDRVRREATALAAQIQAALRARNEQ